jgi:hypothetical protein
VKPGKPSAPGATTLIDVNDSDQVIRLALGALFTAVAIARGARDPLTDIAQSAVVCADALMDAAARARDG